MLQTEKERRERRSSLLPKSKILMSTRLRPKRTVGMSSDSMVAREQTVLMWYGVCVGIEDRRVCATEMDGGVEWSGFD